MTAEVQSLLDGKETIKIEIQYNDISQSLLH
jgi:hypothetical protein